MKKKKIVVVILIIIVLGLTIGFSAFSSSLNINLGATVTPNSNTFKVVFSTSATNVETKNVVASKIPTTLSTGDGVIDNTTSPTIKGLRADFTEPGQKAIYNFYVYNAGEFEAYLNSIVYGNVNSGTLSKECLAGTGASEKLVSGACNSIRITVKVGDLTVYRTKTGITGQNLGKGKSEEVEVTIEYLSNGTRADGPFSVRFGDISFHYMSTSQGEPSSNEICTLVEGADKTIGAKYTCTLDKERTFYVLENNESSEAITLLMDRNYTDDEVPATMVWCGTNVTSNPYVEKIQAKFGSKVTVGIPSYEQMVNVGCSSLNKSCPQWAYDYLDDWFGDYPKPNPVSGISGYWTRSHYIESGIGWSVYLWGRVLGTDANWDTVNGLRPTITVSKSDLA